MKEEENIQETNEETVEKEVNNILKFDKKRAHSGTAHNMNPMGRKIDLMEDEQYIKERVDTQMDWYDKRATAAQKKYKLYKRWEFIIAASIPVIISFAAMGILDTTVLKSQEILIDGKTKIVPVLTLSTIFQIFAAIAGVVVVILNKIVELESYQQNWKEYRLTQEALLQEKFKYLTRTEPYDEEDAFPMLVEKVEAIVNNETQKWKLVTKTSNELTEKAQQSLNAQTAKLQQISSARKDDLLKTQK